MPKKKPTKPTAGKSTGRQTVKDKGFPREGDNVIELPASDWFENFKTNPFFVGIYCEDGFDFSLARVVSCKFRSPTGYQVMGCETEEEADRIVEFFRSLDLPAEKRHGGFLD